MGHPIGFDYKNVPLKTALDSLIEAQRVSVVYQDHHLEGKQTSARCVDCTLEDALNILLLNQSLQWKKKGKQFIVVSTLHSKIKNEFIINLGSSAIKITPTNAIFLDTNILQRK